jgi:hypothetical protein
MDSDEFKQWQDAVLLHCQERDRIVNDRRELKSLFEAHLKQFFDFDSIEFDKDFNVITLKWKKDVSPIIKDNIGELGMEWVISSGYDDMAFGIVVVEVYPFGMEVLEEED